MIDRHFHPRTRRATGNRTDFAHHILAGKHRDHPGKTSGGIDIEALDPGMGIWAAEKSRVQRSYQGNVVNVLPKPLNKRWILTALDPITDQFWQDSHSLLLCH